MSELSIDVLKQSDPPPKEVESGSLNFASLLRWLGCGGVVLSGIVFLLQGFDDISLALRNWAYLGLMLLLGGVGVAVKYAFEDGKSARLLLGLAVAVIPIQFAQLGGMIHSLVAASAEVPNAMAGFADFGALSWGVVLIAGAATVVLACTIGLFGFRVLARPQAKALVLVNTLLCAALLIPVREGVLAVAVFVALGIATLLADIRLGKTNPLLRTLEGRAARLLLVLPLLIAGVRASFYLSDVSGAALLFGMVAGALIVAARHYVVKPALREVMLAVGALGVAAAWGIWSLTVFDFSGVQLALSLFTTTGLFLLAMSSLSAQGGVYRVLGSLVFALGALQIAVSGEGMSPMVTTLLLGLVSAAIGFLKKWRAPMVAGVVLISLTIAPLVVEAVGNVEFGTWIGLAIGGVTLVVMASLVEKHGRRIASYARTSWDQVRTWD